MAKRIAQPIHRRFPTRLAFAIAAALWCIVANSGCDCAGEVGTGAELLIEPASIVFPLTPVGKTDRQSIQLTNKSTLDIEISQLALSKETHPAFQIKSQHTLPLTIKGTQSLTVEIEFAPTEGGGASGALELVSNATNGDAGRFTVRLRSIVNAPDPRLSCAPSLEFGAVRIKEKKTLACTLLNRGTAVWTITEGKLSEGAQQDFTIDAAYPIIVQPGAQDQLINITYSPQDTGQDRAEFKLLTRDKEGKTNDAEAPRLSLRGRAAAARIEVVPNAMIFPFTSGGQATTRPLTARSVGEIELLITAISIEAGSSPNFAIDPSLRFPITIPVGQNKELPIIYKGGATNREQGTLLLESSDPESPIIRVPLYAVSDGCDLAVSPRKLTFPTRKTATVSVVNQGNRACLISSITMATDSSKDYKMVPDKWPAISLAPNQTLEFFVEYRPSDDKGDQGKITIQSDDPDEPTITLELDAPIKVEACELSPNPFVLNFGRTPIGRAATRRLTLVNEGLKPCEITAQQLQVIAPTGSSPFLLAQPPKLPITLAPGAQLPIDVQFSPSQELWYEAALQLKSNDPTRPTLTIKLLGSAAPLCIRAVPEEINMGDVQTGCQARQQSVQIYNLCTIPLTIKGAKLDARTSSEFGLSQAPTAAIKLNRGQATALLIDYKPTDLGADPGTLVVTNDSASLPTLEIPLRGAGVASDTQTDTFVQTSTPKADILFVIDDSFSMAKRQALLAQNLAPFLQVAQSRKVDFQIGVTTTTIRPPSPTSRAGGCVVGTPLLLTPTTPNLLAEFQRRVQVGTQGEAIEQGLEAAYLALTPPLLFDPNCNLGLLRKDASLSVVFVSDEPDQSTQPPAFYSQFFASLRGANQGRIVRISAITAPPAPATCTDATTAGRYWQLAQTFGGVTLSICNANWQSTLQQLADLSFGPQRQFFLSRPATPSSIAVLRNGTAVPASHYTYDPASNAISFKDANTPQPNDKIEIQYKVACKP